MSVDYAVYLVTDAAERYRGGICAGVEAALEGGVSIVQYRPTTETRAEMYQVALALRGLLRARGVPLIVNDHVDLAMAVDANGVHVGQSDLPTTVVRRLIGPGKLIGLSITAESQLTAVGNEVDYLGVGPVFATATKADAAPAVGLAVLNRIAAATDLPIVAIGGIGIANVREVFAAGAAGVAVVSAFSGAADPAGVARALRTAKRVG